MANTLKFGNENWATKKDSILAYNDENANFKPLPFVTSRASTATRVNKLGLIETVASGIPRVDYLGNTKGAYLLEPQSTNLIAQSEAFTNRYWTKSGVSIVGGFASPSADSPLGAYLMQLSNTGGNIYAPVGGTGDYTFSVYAKYKDAQFIRLRSTGSYAYFDIQNGVIGSAIGTTDTNIEALSNGWYKCSVTSINKEKQANVFINDGTTINYQGDGTSGVYIFGSQMEAQSSATSYIKTEGTAITRTADSASKSGISSLINSSEGVLYFEGRTDDSNSTEKNVNLSDGGTQNELKLYFYATSINVTFNINGVNQFYANKTITIGDNYKLAVKFKENDFALWINGIEEVVDSSGIVGVQNLFNKIDLSGFFSNTKDLRVYNTALTDSELTTLTTI